MFSESAELYDLIYSRIKDYPTGARQVAGCLGSSIGYVRTLPQVRRALECFHEHIAEDGVVIVEPWFTPEAMQPGEFHGGWVRG